MSIATCVKCAQMVEHPWHDDGTPADPADWVVGDNAGLSWQALKTQRDYLREERVPEHEQQQSRLLIRPEDVPALRVLEVRVRSSQPDSVVRGGASLSQDGQPESGATPTCPWDGSEVESEGETCDLQCYVSWHAWHLALRNGRHSNILSLGPVERTPLTLEEQPWYRRHGGMETE